MGTFQIELPDGSAYEVEAADEASALEVLNRQLTAQTGIDVKPPPQQFDPAAYGTDWKSARAAIGQLPKDQRKAARNAYADYVVAQERKGGGVGQTINDHLRGFVQNLPFGEFADEARSYLYSGDSGDFTQQMDLEEARRRAIDATDYPGVPTPWGEVDTNDMAKTAGFVGGMFVPFGLAGRAMSTAGAGTKLAGTGVRLGPSAGRLAASGAVGGAITGAAEEAGVKRGNLSERAAAGAKGAVVGGATGGALGYAGGKVSSAINTKLLGAGRKGRSAEQIKKAAQNAYARADKAGAVIDNTAVDPRTGLTFAETLQDAIETRLDDFGYVPSEGTSRVNAIRNRIQELTNGQTFNLDLVERMRQNVSKLSRSTNPQERALGFEIAAGIDEVFDDLTTNAGKQAFVAMGDSDKAVKALKSARDLWRRQVKTDILEDALESARSKAAAANQGANLDNSVRQAFNSILNNKQYQRTKLFSEAERELMSRVVGEDMKGHRLRNALRSLSMWDPTKRFFSQALIGGGMAAGNPVGLVMGAAGLAARRSGEQITEQFADDVLRAVSTGSKRPTFTARQKMLQPYINNPALRAAGGATTRAGALAAALDPTLNEEQDRLFYEQYVRPNQNASDIFDRMYAPKKR